MYIRRVTKRTLLDTGCCSIEFCRILGVNVKGWVRCQMKSLSEFRINIERDSWSRVLVLARDDAGILRNSLC